MAKRLAEPKTSEWYTPPWIVEVCAKILDLPKARFDLDPCAGIHTSLASRGLSEGGLEAEWRGHVWLNPPSPARPWWDKLMGSEADASAFAAYNVDQIAQSVRWSVPMATFPILWIGGRVEWWSSRDGMIGRARAMLEEGRGDADRLRAAIAHYEAYREIGSIPPDDRIPNQPQHETAIVLIAYYSEIARNFASAVASTRIPENTKLFLSRGIL